MTKQSLKLASFGASLCSMPLLSTLNVILWSLTAYVAIAACNIGHTEEIVWHNASDFVVEGKGWTETTASFHRLPSHAEGKVSDAVWAFAKDSAGIAVRFQTDSPTLKVRWSLAKPDLAMPHMPATGVSGVDVYTKSDTGEWEFVANGRPNQIAGNELQVAFPGQIESHRECVVYLPLYNGTTELQIGVPNGQSISAANPRPSGRAKPIVVYGTSIAQGGCASRPGLAWPAILGRLVDRPVINLGFSGSGLMEPEMSNLISEIDASMFIIDCTWNIGDNNDAYQSRVPALVKALRKKHPTAPIVFVGQSHIRKDAHPTPATQFQQIAVQKLVNEQISGLYLVPGQGLIGPNTEGTVDGVHPNDLGMEWQAKTLAPIVSEILDGPKKTTIYIDTDLAAEVDDCYAVYRALVASEFNIVGISAMGWEGPLDFPTNTRASLRMIEEMLEAVNIKEKISHPIGALHPMKAEESPVDSPAARDIIAKAHAMPPGEKLQVFTLGAYTNVASALLLDPTISDKIAVLVMGYRFDNQVLTPTESNTQGDLHAANFLLKSDVELKAMVNSTLRYFQWTKSEMDQHLKGTGGLRDYIVKRWEEYSPEDVQRTVWDIAIFEAVLRPNLAAGRIVDHNGRPVYVWTAVDIPGMKSDFWEAAKVDETSSKQREQSSK